MTAVGIQDLTSELLVSEYTDIGIRQDKAVEDLDNPTYNRLYPRKVAIVAELRSRPGDHRHLLLPLLAHRNRQVRLNAAINTLAIAPDQAVAVLEAIDRSGYLPHAADARGMLRGLRDGSYVPM